MAIEAVKVRLWYQNGMWWCGRPVDLEWKVDSPQGWGRTPLEAHSCFLEIEHNYAKWWAVT